MRRLATTGAAYTASSVLSKLIAVFLLPVYTGALSPADYGAAEVMLASVIAISIVVRLGLIEALLRFYYLARAWATAAPEVIRTGFAALFWSTTLISAICLALAEPISELLLGQPDAELGRLAVLGLWTLTLWEYALTLLRVDERARAYFALTALNVLATIPVTVYFVVVRDDGAAGILIGTFGTGAAFLAWQLWQERHRLALRFQRAAVAADDPLRPADDARRADALLAQLHRPDPHRASRRPRRGGALRAGDQVRAGDQRARPRLPARLAAAGVLDRR